jgi:hypothetical protein
MGYPGITSFEPLAWRGVRDAEQQSTQHHQLEQSLRNC